MLYKNTNKEEALEELYNQHIDSVYRVCFSYLKNKADTEDAVQDTFLRAIQHIDEFTSQSHARAWLIVTSSNICKNILKSWIRKQRSELNDWEEIDIIEHPSSKEESQVLSVLLNLPDKYKTPLYLFYYEEYSCQEIAQAMQKKESTVRSLLRRGRLIMKKRLGGDFDE